jgi:hypothetical protein
MPTRVVRQQLSLTPRQIKGLARLAVRLERTKAELVREAVDRFLADPPRVQNTATIRAAFRRLDRRLAAMGGTEPTATTGERNGRA